MPNTICDFIFVISLCLFPFQISVSAFDSYIENLKVSLENGSLSLALVNCSTHSTGNPSQLFSHFGRHLSEQSFQIDEKQFQNGNGTINLGWDDLSLKIKSIQPDCWRVEWSTSLNISLEDCIDLNNNHWYGGAEQSDQYWPIETAVFREYSYVTKQADSQAIAERYWLNSNGLFIYVDSKVPLFIDQNNHKNNSLCLISKRDAPYIRKSPHYLEYTFCKKPNPRIAHEFAVNEFLGRPKGVPSKEIVKHPIWSTWAKYKTHINEDVVMDFAEKIKRNGFNCSQLEIDDAWETCYGSLSFNESRFSNMKELTIKLNVMGFKTSLWVHPFVNINCQPIYTEALSNDFFVKNTDGEVKTTWWNGNGSYIDFTNKAAAKWFEDRLTKMMKTNGIDSLKFDAGESGWSPQVPVLRGDEDVHPESILQYYIKSVAKFGDRVEARAAYRTQEMPIFIRMLDRDTAWGMKRLGLSTVITTTFQMNLNGYPFVLPDMVGGNAYNNEVVTKEFFIRYLQVNTFLPAIQFSIPPWDFDQETIALSKKFTTLHYQYSDKIVELMHKAVETGQPINPPIWWIAPTDETAQGINSEYMLGEDILVAPVLEEGAISRDIYLPAGKWRDEADSDKKIYSGPVWLTNYSAPLHTLPYFTRVHCIHSTASFIIYSS